MPLSERTRNALIKNDILTTENLRQYSEDDLIRLKGIGKVAVMEIKQALNPKEQIGRLILSDKEKLLLVTLMNSNNAINSSINSEQEAMLKTFIQDTSQNIVKYKENGTTHTISMFTKIKLEDGALTYKVNPRFLEILLRSDNGYLFIGY